MVILRKMTQLDHLMWCSATSITYTNMLKKIFLIRFFGYLINAQVVFHIYICNTITDTIEQ